MEKPRLSKGIGRFGTLLAALLAIVAQYLMSTRGLSPLLGIVPGVVLYVMAAIVLLRSLAARAREGTGGGPEEGAPAGEAATRHSRRFRPEVEWSIIAALVLGALFFRMHHIDTIPAGLNNDEAINALEATEIADGRPFSTLTERGLNRETMFHHLAALSYMKSGLALNLLRSMPAVFSLQRKLVDDTMMDQIFPLRAVSIGIGVLTVLALYLFARRHFGSRVALLAAVFLAVSPWHVMYSRVGLRAILAPLFAIATVALFLRARDSGRLREHLMWGVVLGLGFWTYTSFRAVPLAILAFALLRRFYSGEGELPRRESTRPLLLGAGLAVAIFVLLMLLSPLTVGDFLFRGAYAVLPQSSSWALNLFHAATILNYFPSSYAVVQSDSFISDGVSATFGTIGFEPETIIVAALATLGMVYAGRRALVRPRDPRCALLLLCVGAVLFTVGWMGPSLTRMLISLPWFCLFAALLAGRAADDIARLRPPLTVWGGWVLVLAVGVLGCAQAYSNYFLHAGRSERAMQYFWPRQTVMGMFVRAIPPGPIVYVMHSHARETLTHLIGERENVHLVTDPSTLDLEEVGKMRESAIFVVEFSEFSRPFAEALAYLVNRYGTGGIKQYADMRFDPEKEIFYTYTLLKDAAGRLVTPPGSPAGLPEFLPPPEPGVDPPGQ